MRFILFIFFCVLFTTPAHAQDCTNPSAAAGTMMYNTSFDVFQGCTKRGWYALHEPDSGGAPTNCPNIGDQCDDGSYYIGDIGAGKVYATAAASESSQSWNDGTTNYSTTGLTSTTDGAGNTATLIGLTGASDYPFQAAEYCDGLTNVHGYSDWYLPAKDELNLFWNGGTPVAGVVTDGSWYWSSTEGNSSTAWIQRFSVGSQSNTSKYPLNLVRCVRR